MTFGDDLEKKCRELVRGDRQQSNEPAALIRREIALTLHQIDVVRRQDEELRRQLEQQRLGIGSKILNLEPLPHHSAQFWFERNRLMNQLKHTEIRLGQQSLRLALDSRKTLNDLHDRLLQLLNKHEQLDSSDLHGNTGYPSET